MENKSQPTSKKEEMIKEVRKIMEKRGRKALELAKESIFKENIQSKEIREALKYFMEYWNDLARPSLINLCCEAVDGDPEVTVSFGAAITLICGATDIHDDIIDKSKRKMSHLTIFGKFGEDIALLLGDYLFFKGFSILNKSCKEISVEKASKVRRVLENMLFEMGDGEALELRFRNNLNVELQEYLSLLKMKAADIEACARIGAILGGGSEKEVDVLGKYGRMLGTIFILRDDLADAFDYEELFHRIKHESLPLPLILTLKNPETKAETQRIICKEKIKKEDMDILSKLINKAKAVTKVRRIINDMYLAACSYLREMRCMNKELKILLDATTFL